MIYESMERIRQGELKADGQLTPGVESLKKKKKGQRKYNRDNLKCTDIRNWKSSGSTCHKGLGDQNAVFRDTDQEQGLWERVSRAWTKKEETLPLISAGLRLTVIVSGGWRHLQFCETVMVDVQFSHFPGWIIARLSLKWCHRHLEVAGHWTSRVSVISSFQIGGQTGLISQKTELRGRLLSLGSVNEKKYFFWGELAIHR